MRAWVTSCVAQRNFVSAPPRSRQKLSYDPQFDVMRVQLSAFSSCKVLSFLFYALILNLFYQMIPFFGIYISCTWYCVDRLIHCTPLYGKLCFYNEDLLKWNILGLICKVWLYGFHWTYEI
ncbi:unnamed protein product [Clavelina lepadiformis]|uniref:Succinate dehydrogenase subunit 3 n=1 Tax=Clavelina lepadiformis TaxID=159417 RepID=A0ABP0FC21_CLALP